jgi:hypothetical protein
MSYVIYQFKLSEEAKSHLNSVGWDGDFTEFPEIMIKRDVSFANGSEKYEPWMGDYYKTVARVTGTANCLEDVFNIGNGYGKCGASIQRFCQMHSVSVGDIIVNEKEGTSFMCDPIGWTSIPFQLAVNNFYERAL